MMTEEMKRRILSGDLLGEGAYWLQVEDLRGNVVGPRKTIHVEYQDGIDHQGQRRKGLIMVEGRDYLRWDFEYCTFHYLFGKGSMTICTCLAPWGAAWMEGESLRLHTFGFFID